MELFIHHVMYNVLTRPNYEKALKLVRSLDWDDDKVDTGCYARCLYTDSW